MVGIDEKGMMFGIELQDGEEVSEDTFTELSNGKGDSIDE